MLAAWAWRNSRQFGPHAAAPSPGQRWRAGVTASVAIITTTPAAKALLDLLGGRNVTLSEPAPSDEDWYLNSS
jgi:hypothetical protein